MGCCSYWSQPLYLIILCASQTSFTGSLIGAIQDGVYLGRCMLFGRMQFAQFSRIPELNSVPKHVSYLSIYAMLWLCLVRLAKYMLVTLHACDTMGFSTLQDKRKVICG